jgi:hypothetical protein
MTSTFAKSRARFCAWLSAVVVLVLAGAAVTAA